MLGYAIQQLCKTVETNSRRYVVMTAADQPKGRYCCYRRVAVVKTDGVNMPKQIHPRHNAVKEIVETWNMLFAGTSDKCQFAIAKRQAEALADRLNRPQTESGGFTICK